MVLGAVQQALGFRGQWLCDNQL